MPQDQKSTVLEQAAEWYFRRDAGALSPQDEARFAAWLQESPEHQAAYLELAQTWAELGALPHVESNTRPWRMARRQAVTAFVAAACVLAFVFGFDLPMRYQADAYTGTGESRTVTLDDGSSVTLDANSALSVRFTHQARRLLLLRGKAVFTVAHDSLRPFLVDANGGETQALGTVFAVSKDDDGATVTVLESRVGVSYPAETASRVEVVPNEEVHYTAAGVGSVRPVDADAVLSWRRGKLIFVDRTLGSVIGELNRYHKGLIKITDPAIIERRVSGVFQTQDPIAALNSIESTLGLHSTRLTPYVILLHE